MKTLVLLAGLVVISPNTAHADYFQVFEGTYYIPHARVILNNKTIGYTDAYGRIKIGLPQGKYQAQIEYRNRTKTVRLLVDGKQNLKRAEAF